MAAKGQAGRRVASPLGIRGRQELHCKGKQLGGGSWKEVITNQWPVSRSRDRTFGLLQISTSQEGVWQFRHPFGGGGVATMAA